jgi:hypothetical protein
MTQHASTKTRLKDMTGRMPQPASKLDCAGTGSWLVGSLLRENEHDRKERDDHREAPEGLHGLIAGSGERLDQSDCRDSAAEHAEHRRAPHLFRVGGWLSLLWIASSSSSMIAKSVRA